MKDSKGREISISRLDMLEDDEIQQLKDDSWDDFCWKSGNQYARMVHEFCVIEQDKRIRAEEARRVAAKLAAIELESERRLNQAKMDMLLDRHAFGEKRRSKRPEEKPKEGPKEIPPPSIGIWNDRWKKNPMEFGPSGERLTGRMRERLTGTA